MATLGRLGRAAARAAAALRGCAAESAAAARFAAPAALSGARGFASGGVSRHAAPPTPFAARGLQPPQRGFSAGAGDAPAAAAPSPLMQGPPPPGSAAALAAGASPGARGAPRTAQAVRAGLRISPKKLNVVAQLTRGLSVEQALAQCELLPKKAARLVLVALRSAQANATHNHGLAAERLVVQKAFVGKGRFLKRIKFHARGKTGVMHHGVSRLTIVLEERPLGLRLSKRTARPAEGRASKAPRGAQGDAALAPGEGAAKPAAAPEVSPLLPSWMRHRRRRLAKRARAAAAAAAPRAAAKM